MELSTDIDQAGCGYLLASTPFGHLAVVDGTEPALVVLNHRWDGEYVLFRTSEDTMLSRLTAAGRETSAVFEVDSTYPMKHEGWSVIAHGSLARESDPDRCADAHANIATWAGENRNLVLRLKIHELTGRRVGLT
jgi:uncharacterized protein